MDPLSKDADTALKSLLDVEPSREDEARVRAELEKSLGIVLPLAAAATSTAVASAVTAKSGLFASLSVGAKVSLVTVAVVAAGATTVAVRRMTKPLTPTVPVVTAAPPPRPLPQPPAFVRPDVEPEPELATPPEPELELVLRAPPQPELPRRAKAPVVAKQPQPVDVAAPPPPAQSQEDALDVNAVPQESVAEALAREYPSCDLTTEQRLSMHVRSLPRAGAAARGLELLTAYQHRCATGHWTYDSWVARFAVLCALERRQEVTELWAWFSQENERHVSRMRRDLEGVCSF